MNDRPDVVARATDAVMEAVRPYEPTFPRRVAEILAVAVLDLHDNELTISKTIPREAWNDPNYRAIFTNGIRAEWWNRCLDHLSAPVTMPEVTARPDPATPEQMFPLAPWSPYPHVVVTVTGKTRELPNPPTGQRDDSETTPT